MGGVILSGASDTEDGFLDAHNSHLDPASGFTLEDGHRCATTVAESAGSAFIGMKCGVSIKEGTLSADEVLTAEAEFLNSL